MNAVSSEQEPALKKERREVDPPITFPYELDTFQKESIDALENGDSVLVSAHTSAGKTTVALYAIAKALREKKRVIYTSPIKALSNQKFREFSEKFDSVGLMTGDTTIKSDSDCLVMTTEILRSMLYRGTEMLREVGCVIFDEVHYMRDKSRGVVWEETIILLPEGCQYVFLSATIPNAREFSLWVESIHPNTKVHVIHTNYRPVPLQHYLYPAGAEGIYLIVDENGKFRDDNFNKAMVSVGSDSNAQEAAGGEGNRGPSASGPKARGRSGTQPIMEIVKLVMDKNMYPVIVFSFAKSECERNALALSRLNFNNTEEDALVTEVFNNAIESLAEEDRKLPAIEHLLPLLKRGVGIHHSGLLPILKEVVEILFQAGLVKVLFSTETFSMGLNMPARTVVFTAVKKYDGEKNRYLTGGEYIQMSGRAGRRGLDRVGVVIAMVDEAVEPDTLKQLTGGGADVLLSSFYLTYNMVLNLLRVEDVDPEFMMKRSFAQFQRLSNKPALEHTNSRLKAEMDEICVQNEEVFRQYTLCHSLITKRKGAINGVLRQPRYLKNWIQPGRFVRIVRDSDQACFGWGVCRSFAAKSAGASPTDASAFTINVAVICQKVDSSKLGSITPCHVTAYTSVTADLYTLAFDFSDIECLSTLKANLPPQPDSEQGRGLVVQTLSRLHREFGEDKIPKLSVAQMGIEDLELEKLQSQVSNLEKQLEGNALYNNPTEELKAEYEIFKHKAELEDQIEEVNRELVAMNKAVFSEELKQMMRVLRRLDYIDKENIILRKSRIACEITTTDENEILLTELLFKGVLNSMETEMIVALLSCLVNVHRMPDGFSLPQEFEQPLKELNEIVTRISTVCVESNLTQEKSAVDKVMPSLMEVTYLWAKGTKFIDLVSKTTAYEGEIVRMMRRLEEMLRQLASAARSPAIGSMELHDKFIKGIQLIKRDIVFASSLYL
ncbi:unnamed protein product [Phytomonas sp. Hart1]|nr:unnamed protein product [Phytomonas sp. Hart1]|eukprot:CCW66876.1 unnamed protein product [Phytomonas sp. isolate Hart1]